MKELWKICVCGVVKFEDKYLIVKRSSEDPTLAGLWEFPSGGVNNGEKLDEALNRELQEEVGLNFKKKSLRLIGTSEYEIQKKDEIRYTVQLNYLFELSSLPQIILSSEHSNYDWVREDDSRIDDFLREIINGK